MNSPTRCARASSALFSEALAQAKIPVLDVATRYSEVGEALLPLINPVIDGEIRHRVRQLHPRKRERAAGSRAGDRQALVDGRGRQSERLREIPNGPGHGAAGQAAARADSPREMAVGMAMAQQMMQQAACSARKRRRASRGRPAAAVPTGATPRRCPRRTTCAVLAPATSRIAGVSEGDVLATIEAGDLKAKKIGSTWRITRAAWTSS